MGKIYSKKVQEIECLQPKKETIEFLLSYSKAFHLVTYKELKFENILN